MHFSFQKQVCKLIFTATLQFFKEMFYRYVKLYQHRNTAVAIQNAPPVKLVINQEPSTLESQEKKFSYAL